MIKFYNAKNHPDDRKHVEKEFNDLIRGKVFQIRFTFRADFKYHKNYKWFEINALQKEEETYKNMNRLIGTCSSIDRYKRLGNFIEGCQRETGNHELLAFLRFQPGTRSPVDLRRPSQTFSCDYDIHHHEDALFCHQRQIFL